MLAHEFLGAGDGLQSHIDDLELDLDVTLLAAGYTHYPEHSIDVPEGNIQVGAVVWQNRGILYGLVSHATLDYCPDGKYDDKTTDVVGDAVELITVTDDSLPFRGDYYRVRIGDNEDGVKPADYYVYRPTKPVTSPLGFLAVKQ